MICGSRRTAPARRTASCCSTWCLATPLSVPCCRWSAGCGRFGHSRGFAATLNAARRPFHLINYLGSCARPSAPHDPCHVNLLDRIIRALRRSLAAETDQSLALTMNFPTGWDPYFKPTMSVLDVYHYGTQHFDHHRRQLTLTTPRAQV